MSKQNVEKAWEKKLQMQIAITLSGLVMQTVTQKQKKHNTHDVITPAKAILTLIKEEREKWVKEIIGIIQSELGADNQTENILAMRIFDKLHKMMNSSKSGLL